MINKQALINNLREYTIEQIAMAVQCGIVTLDELSASGNLTAIKRRRIEERLSSMPAAQSATMAEARVESQPTPQPISSTSFSQSAPTIDLQPIATQHIYAEPMHSTQAMAADDNKPSFPPYYGYGRMRRSNYFGWMMLYLPIMFLISAVAYSTSGSHAFTAVIIAIFSTSMIIPSIKRCHDCGASGWFVLIPISPIALMFIKGEKGRNKYGDDPKKAKEANNISAKDLRNGAKPTNTEDRARPSTALLSPDITQSRTTDTAKTNHGTASSHAAPVQQGVNNHPYQTEEDEWQALLQKLLTCTPEEMDQAAAQFRATYPTSSHLAEIDDIVRIKKRYLQPSKPSTTQQTTDTIQSEPTKSQETNSDNRMRRRTYVLCMMAIFLASGFFMSLIEGRNGEVAAFIILSIAKIISIPLNAKRCHDIGNSGWYQFIPFYDVALVFTPGDKGPNKYGDDPKNK